MRSSNKSDKVIAVVDDDETFRFIFSAQLAETEAESRVLQFDDGYTILDYLLENKENPVLLPDIIFLDLAMKQVDGWVFIEEYKNIKKFLPKDITIHILTGSTEEEYRLKASSNPLVHKYLIKPVSNSDLKELL